MRAPMRPLRLLTLLAAAAAARTGRVGPKLKVCHARAAHAPPMLPRRALLAAPLLLLPQPSHASTAKLPTTDELSRLAKGYARLTYLLDNWEKETTVCIKGCVGKPENCGCIRDPLVVQSYMGYKSMNDPLFKADQIMIRAQPMVQEPEDFERYSAAIDRWMEKADEGNVMAYVSSWGEANPGGGRDNVERYLEKARLEVIESRQILRTIIDILGIPPVEA